VVARACEEEQRKMKKRRWACNRGYAGEEEKKEKKEWDKIRDTWRDVIGWGDFPFF
jgi:hypothetical protein